jgi:hypothetical protein
MLGNGCRLMQTNQTRPWAVCGAATTSHSSLPGVRISTCVKNRYNSNVIGAGYVENTKRESPSQCPPDLATHERVCCRILGNSIEYRFHGQQELIAQTRALLLIPTCGLDQIGLGISRELDGNAH